MHGKMFAFKEKQQNHPEAHLKNGTKIDYLTPRDHVVITDSNHYIDNLFADTRFRPCCLACMFHPLSELSQISRS